MLRNASPDFQALKYIAKYFLPPRCFWNIFLHIHCSSFIFIWIWCPYALQLRHRAVTYGQHHCLVYFSLYLQLGPGWFLISFCRVDPCREHLHPNMQCSKVELYHSYERQRSHYVYCQKHIWNKFKCWITLFDWVKTSGWPNRPRDQSCNCEVGILQCDSDNHLVHAQAEQYLRTIRIIVSPTKPAKVIKMYQTCLISTFPSQSEQLFCMRI